jgi:DNA transposition AAA+ family ATPase
MNEAPGTTLPDATLHFVETKEYRRFAEFCAACRRYRYIGLCHGPAGVGKTLSARHYAHWEALETVFAAPEFWQEPPVQAAIADCRTLVYTPSVTVTPSRLGREFTHLRSQFDFAVDAAQPVREDEPLAAVIAQRWVELVIVDEADRLKFTALEALRDLYDRGRFGLVLVGMPGLERRLARYAQFYSRVGFVHQFRPPAPEEVRFLLEQQWPALGLRLDPDTFGEREAMTAILRMTGGNFRLLQRLLTQIARVLAINQLAYVTSEVVEAARESLVIGTA